jgi:hypothetical protein
MALAEWNARPEQALDDRHVDRLPLVKARDSLVKWPPFGLNRSESQGSTQIQPNQTRFHNSLNLISRLNAPYQLLKA